VIFLLKHLGELASQVVGVVVLAVQFLQVVGIETIVCHVVDEEERQHLDVLREELALSLDVGADGLLNLDAAQQVFVHLADGIALEELDAIEQLDAAFRSVDALDDVTVLVFL